MILSRRWVRLPVAVAAALSSCRTAGGAAPAAVSPDPGLVAEGHLALLDPPESGAPGADAYRFVLPTQVHGHVLSLIADHGAGALMLTDSSVDVIGVPHWYSQATRADTIVKKPGVVPRIDTTASATITRRDTVFEYWGDFEPPVIDSVRVGRSLQDNVAILAEAPRGFLRSAAGILGRDVLSQFDLEFDMPAGTLRLYSRRAASPGDGSVALPVRTHGASSCVAAHVRRHSGVDTTGMDASDSAEFSKNPGKRLWEAEELLLPVVANGRPMDAVFDSGSGLTVMNWAEARALGIDRGSPAISKASTGRLAPFLFHSRSFAGPDSLAVEQDSEPNYNVAGVSLSVAGVTLPADTVVISDLTFADMGDFRGAPMMLVGLKHFRDNPLFLSYSTRNVCVGRSAR